jgi:3-keto-5-aminohexanoate cleavage enzyme
MPRKETMSQEVIITVALTGSRPTKAMNPAVPITPEEIVAAAVDCCQAGAAIAHIHVRDPQTGRPAFDVALFKPILEGIRERCDMIVNLTTSGLFLEGPDMIDQRLAPASLGPDICSLDLGSMNFADRAFVNPPEWAEAASQRMRAAGVKPEIEVFDTGHIEQARHLVDSGWIAAPPYFQLCMGVRWGIAATPENLLFMQSKLPEGAQWSVLGVGKHQLPMLTMGLLLGGHVRVGFEDNIYLEKGVLAASNAQIVERIAHLAEHLGRRVASPPTARRILGIQPR